MNEAAPRAPLVSLARGQTAALSAIGPAVIQGGPADLLIGLADGRRSFVATLEPGTLVPGGTSAGPLFLRARRRLVLTRTETRGGLGLWLTALQRAAVALAVPVNEAVSPDDAEAEGDRLLAGIAAVLAEDIGKARSAAPTETQDATFRTSLAGFGRLIAGTFHRAPAGQRGALAGAASALAEVMGARPVPVSEQDGETRADYLERFATAHGLRLRTIRLEAGRRLEGEGPVLAFDGDDVPLVLKPRTFGGYDMDALIPGGTTRRMTGADWTRLAPIAFAFCRTLPEGPLTFRSVLGFGLKAAVADFVLVAACGVAGALLALLPPIASQQITNIAAHTADTGFLAELLGALLVALFVETAFFAIGQLAELRAQGQAGLTLHAAMVDRLLRLSPADLRSSTTLILATEMETVEKFRRALIGFASAGLIALFYGLAAAALVAFISPVAGLLAIGLVGLLVAVTALVGWLQFKAIYEGERMDVVVLAFVYDLIRLVPVARGSRLEKRAFTQWSENFLAFQTRLMRSARFGNGLAVFEPLWDALVLATCFAALAYAGAGSSISAGEAVAFVLALGRLTRAGKGLSHALMGAAKLLPMAKLARPLLDFKVEPLVTGPPVPSLSGRVDVADVSFFYGARRALDQVSFSIRDGEFVSIAGPSGSGKSTLLSVLVGLERPQSGRVLLDGHDLSRIDRRQVSRRIAVVMQNSRLFPGSLYENIRGVSDIDLDAAWHFAEKAGVAEELKALPMGLRTIVSEAGAGLSLGQIQRILIARALAQSPAVLILDEAMSALDGTSLARVMETLQALDLTRIVVAHRPSVWARTDRLLVLRDGALVASGPPHEILSAMPSSPAQPLASP